MMKKLLSLLLLTLLFSEYSQAQFTRYVVRLKNKGGTPHTIANPLTYLSQRAIDRRTRYGIAIDSTDLPLTPSYVTQIRNVTNVTVLNVSKWLNAVAIQVSNSDPNAVNTITAFPFVQSVTGVAARAAATPGKYAVEEIVTPALPQGRVAADYFNYGTNSYNEIHLHFGEFLHNVGLRGQGMQIAMLDGGFFNYTTFDAFDSANTNNQFLSTWDFVAREQSVVEDNSHGMSCLSTIAANIPGQFIGKAPKASFHLFRTEDVATEHHIELFNWACGVERADSVGADVISTSVGYSIQFTPPSTDLPYSSMDGNTNMTAIAGDLAAKKGMMVFSSIGNDGNEPVGNYLTTPSDGDSVLAVGAVNTSGAVASFSSYGPSFDGQVKPDFASVGVAALIQSASNTVSFSNGTSFASPKMAGLGTCLWQGFPEYNNMKIGRAMQQAGSIAGTPNNRIGYGIPNMKTAFKNLLIEFATSSATVTDCNVTINWNSKDVSAMKYEIERKAPGEPGYTKVGEVTPQAGVILTNRSYQFINALVNVNAGTVSYRIRQIIDTATASFTDAYIDTANVTIASSCFLTGTGNPTPDNVLIQVQPNPSAESTVSLVVQTPYAVPDMPIAVFDNKGRLVMQLRQSKGTGRVVIDLPSGKLAKGKYYIRVFNAQKTIGVAEMLRL